MELNQLLTNVAAVRHQIFPQSLVLELERFREFADPLPATPVRLHPGVLLLGEVVALVSDPLEFRWTHGVHSLDSSLGGGEG